MSTAATGAFFGHMGVAIALSMANLGAAYGTAKSGVGIASMGVLKPDMIMKSIVPIIMAGILGIYGLIVAVILLQKSKSLLAKLIIIVKYLVDSTNYSLSMGYKHLVSGLCCGFSGVVSAK